MVLVVEKPTESLPEVYFAEPVASVNDRMRANQRKVKTRLTFDCFNAVVQNGRLVCRCGHSFKGGLSVLCALKGNTSQVCLTCPDFEGE